MAADNKTKILKLVRERKYLNKDFDALKQDILQHAKQHFKDKIQDFSEASVGGLLLDFAAMTGDMNSFYLDHQFSELFADTAIEDDNLEHMIREAGVPIVGASPAVVSETFLIEVPSEQIGSTYSPRGDVLPIIHQDTSIASSNGTGFVLTEDIDFSEIKSNGSLKAVVSIGKTRSDNSPLTFVLKAEGICVSGKIATETFRISSNFVPFRSISLQQSDITEITSINDSLGNVYYEVQSLSQDVVFRRMDNLNEDNELVKEVLDLIPAPYRYTKSVNPSTRITTLQFGGGSADTLDDDIIPDPSEFALPLFGKKTFNTFTLDPNRLLSTRTLGVATTNTTLTITYRYGGGLKHNSIPNSITNITNLIMTFPKNPAASIASSVRGSVEATNVRRASGGDNAPSLEDLRSAIPAARNGQNRVVTKEDLIARIYTLPSNFGRIFRANIRPNPNNPVASQLFIISRDLDEKLISSPDSLKRNLRTYLNNLRLVSDAVDILDARVVNLKLEFEIVADPLFNRNIIIQNVITKLRGFLHIKNFQIDQPINLSDINNVIFNNPGVISVNNFTFKSLSGRIDNRDYSDIAIDVKSSTIKKLLIPPAGGIFEFRYLDFDIAGMAI